MRVLHILRALPLTAALALTPLIRLPAQASSQNVSANSGVGAASTAKPALKTLNLDDYSGWNRIGNTAISRDGKWMTFAYTPNEGGDPVLHVKSLDTDKEYVIAVGAAAGGGGRAGGGRGAASGGAANGGSVFSEDSHWAAYMVNPPGRAGGGTGRGGRGGPTPGGRGAAQGGQTPPAPGRLELLNLMTGEKSSIPNAGSWKFSATSRWIAVRFNRPQAAAAANGTTAAPAPASNGADLILRDLTTGADHAIGNVDQYDFDDDGKLLAYTIDAAEKLGNGVYVLDPATGTTRALNTGSATYDGLAWSGEGTNLAALRGEKSKEMKQRENTLLAWTALGGGAGKALVFDPRTDA